ncbi:helix-turn-helix domain-containing protein [Nocardia amikacinitolerans]|uniref:helix-turn-helix domain-containing protein n=1 Tax=Nocardia amikacinitolerans TaxID=756689 RepID=UPI0020A5E417|nr:helix-turn-helix transcriptional regulator [Nocardia amikacinitolerans]
MDRSGWLRRNHDGALARTVGQVIREYRLAGGANQAAVADALGITQQFLSQVEKGTRKATLEQRQGFARVLGIPPEELGIASRVHGRAVTDGTPAVAASRGRWRTQRHWLNRHRDELGRLATQWYHPEHRLLRTSLITCDGWMPTAPMDLDSIRLNLDEGPQVAELTGAEQETAPVRPLRVPTLAFETYSAAVKHLDPPHLFESRPSYRYLGGTTTSGAMNFGLAAYFDKLDVSEALAHELAAACLERPTTDVSDLKHRLLFRELIGDPFDPRRRAIIPAVTTLTIRLRRFPAPPSFLLHWRDPSRVATAAGVYDVIPAGEFQPSSMGLWDRRNDFSLWRNMVREYSEELLGYPEHDGTRSVPIDYENWPFYRRLSSARAEGKVTAHLLGFGLDALTLAATLLTVVIIDDDVFDEIFGAVVEFNDEGEVVGIGNGRAADGVPFTQESVARMLEAEPMAAPGAACLALAWQHRNSLIS